MTAVVRSALFVPGSSDAMLAKAFTRGADVVILDLEDAVSPSAKAAARDSVVKTLIDAPASTWVRINGVGGPEQILDVEAIARSGAEAILLPKADVAAVTVLEDQLDALGTDIRVVALIETPRGLLEAAAMASKARRLIGLQLGAEDLTKEMQVPRTLEGREIAYPRAHLAMVGHAFGLHVLDTPTVAINDPAALAHEISAAKAVGMTGKTCIHPAQVEEVNRAFAPDPSEIEQARRIVEAFDRAQVDGHGAVSLDGQMLDAPIAERARRLIAAASVTDTSHTTKGHHHG